MSDSVHDETGAEIFVNDVVQINPAHDERFGACLMIVSELKPAWNGLQGYVKVPAGGDAYYRLPSDKTVKIGHVAWSHQEEDGQ